MAGERGTALGFLTWGRGILQNPAGPTAALFHREDSFLSKAAGFRKENRGLGEGTRVPFQ